MKIPFDKELAKLVIAAGTGKIVTAGGLDAEVTEWDYRGFNPNYTLTARSDGLLGSLFYTSDGKLYVDAETVHDLQIEITDEEFYKDYDTSSF
jgi:hypothetical protein